MKLPTKSDFTYSKDSVIEDVNWIGYHKALNDAMFNSGLSNYLYYSALENFKIITSGIGLTKKSDYIKTTRKAYNQEITEAYNSKYAPLFKAIHVGEQSIAADIAMNSEQKQRSITKMKLHCLGSFLFMQEICQNMETHTVQNLTHLSKKAKHLMRLQ